MLFRIPKLICKLIQRQTYSCLSTNHGIWFLFCGLCLILVSAFHFGEVWLQWSASHYAGKFQFSRYYDNIVGRSFQSRLCLPQPIDIVYTWVNGSDPILVKKLNIYKEKLTKELGDTSRSARRTKLVDSDRFKWKSKTVCPVPNCVAAYRMAISGLPSNIGMAELQRINANFTFAKNIFNWDEQVTMVSFESRELIHHLIQAPLKYNNVHLNTSEVFYTSFIKSGYRKIDATLMLLNVDVNSTADEIKGEIEAQLPNSVSSIQMYHDVNLGVITFVDQKFSAQLKSMSSLRNFTINKQLAKVLPATYVWLPITAGYDDDEDFGANRFADNEELKYSLRSVERFAPWVRKIFIVTNGQIPNWLNLNHPRITLITHDDIFLNKSHLPTFSSPAIESHIHRIQGLSKKFIYMNDDVFFGLPVWPDDFYTHSKGHKVFLSWAVPNCAEGCPASWVNDKYCDKACNVSACEWDGGDCLGAKANNKWSLQVSYNQYSKTLGEYCSQGCAHNWVGDRYCDANCNTFLCGFDAGDCGLLNLNQLYSYSFDSTIFSDKTFRLSLPKGTLSMYFNLSNIFDSLVEGNYQDSKILRTSVISKKFKILSLTFFKNMSETTLSFQVLGYKSANKTDKAVAAFSFNISTIALVKPTKASKSTMHMSNTSSIPKFPETLYNQTAFHIVMKEVGNVHIFPQDLSNLSLPVKFSDKLMKLKKSFDDGDITEYGFNKSQQLIHAEYLKETPKNVGRKLLWISNEKEPAVIKKILPRKGFSAKSDNLLLEKLLSNQFTRQFSFLPWEKGSFMTDCFALHKKQDLLDSYTVKKIVGRHLMDAFSSSLLHVSRIYNKEFGYMARKVPAHMPHMVDREIISEMQERFMGYFDATSSHKLRHPEDMQFAFSFNYYLIGLRMKANLSEVFDKVDSDHSGWLSEREQRNLAAMLYPLPLSLMKMKKMEDHLRNCSQRLKLSPKLTKRLFLNCHQLWSSLNLTAESNKYPHEIQGEDDIIFKMIRNNVSYVLHQLDWIRKNRKKFICLNDDLDHKKESSKTIRALLKDFYESFFPIPSQFELAPRYQNKFSYKWELNEWMKVNEKQNEKVNVLIMLLIIVLCVLLYRRKLIRLCKRLHRVCLGYRRSRVFNVLVEERINI